MFFVSSLLEKEGSFGDHVSSVSSRKDSDDEADDGEGFAQIVLPP